MCVCSYDVQQCVCIVIVIMVLRITAQYTRLPLITVYRYVCVYVCVPGTGMPFEGAMNRTERGFQGHMTTAPNRAWFRGC